MPLAFVGQMYSEVLVVGVFCARDEMADVVSEEVPGLGGDANLAERRVSAIPQIPTTMLPLVTRLTSMPAESTCG
jgi:hypothetical protein